MFSSSLETVSASGSALRRAGLQARDWRRGLETDASSGITEGIGMKEGSLSAGGRDWAGRKGLADWVPPETEVFCEWVWLVGVAELVCWLR